MQHISPVTFTKIAILDDIPMYPIRALLRKAEEMDISGSDFDAYISDRMKREQEKHNSDPEKVLKTFVFDKMQELKDVAENNEVRVFNCLRRSLYGSDGYDICDKYWKIRKFADMTDDQVARIRNLGSKTMPVAFKIREKARDFITEVDNPANKVVAVLKVMADGHVDGYLTTEEYAKKNNMKVNTVQVQIERGNLEAIKANGMYFIKSDAIVFHKRLGRPRGNKITVFPGGYLTVKDYAAKNNVKDGTVRMWIRRGVIESVTINGVKAIHEDAKPKHKWGQMIEVPDGYLTVKDYAKLKNIKEVTVRAMITRGNLKAANIQGRNFIKVDEVPCYKNKSHIKKKKGA